MVRLRQGYGATTFAWRRLVEAAGVEPATRIENTQLIDSEIASNAENATISKSAVQSLYKHC